MIASASNFPAITGLALKPLEASINAYLSLDPELPAKLGAFEDKVVCLEFRGTWLKLYLRVQQGAIRLASDIEGQADAVISGSPAAMLKLGVQDDAAPLLFAREVDISGDARFGRQFRKLLTEMEIDWEEQLSRLIGDVASHQTMRTIDAVLQWGKRAVTSFADDAGEYLREESRDVVADAELQQFYQQVDELRDGTERLQARINRLRGNGRQSKT
jgi:ubiquinone biosynthesis accessory factor UbiJ